MWASATGKYFERLSPLPLSPYRTSCHSVSMDARFCLERLHGLLVEVETMTHAAHAALQELPCYRLPEDAPPEKRRALGRLQVLVAAADEKAKAALAEAIELSADLHEQDDAAVDVDPVTGCRIYSHADD